MTVAELKRERRVIHAWIRDVMERKHARLRAIEAEIKQIELEGMGEACGSADGAKSGERHGAQRVAAQPRG